MTRLAIVGAGYVADLYMASLRFYPELEVVAVHDIDGARRDAFCAHWGLPAVGSLGALIDATGRDDIVLNLTNPHAHYAVSRACLEAGRHVYSEKPLAMDLDEARALVELAAGRDRLIAAAPCSGLSEAAQTLWAAIREEKIGKPRLVYAELDDDFIPQAPYAAWISASGAPWPAADEFRVGCTVEHAGYYLAWLLPIFGPVRTVVAASATLADKEIPVEESAPDISIGTLFFHNGVVARLTCSILAPHNHALTVVGDAGVLTLEECWNNTAPVKLRRRFTLRRRLMMSPLPRRLRLAERETHRKVGRTGAASMNFALGPVEMRDALAEKRACRLSPDLALHITEVTLALQSAGEHAGAWPMTTTFDPVDPMPWAARLA
jgi:predicted dehydrogenase